MDDFEKEFNEKVNALVETQTQTPVAYSDNVIKAIGTVESRIVEKAVDKVNDEKIIEEHSKKLAEISDKALEVETEKQELVVESRRADNRVKKQEIKNRLLQLKTEKIRLKREQKQVLKEQKAEHKKRNKEALWELYKDKLTKMKYTYVPNKFVLKMLLFFDGVKSFFDGLGSVSTAIMKAFKWFIIIGILVGVLFAIPVTREWLTGILS
jgi:hypothetical protein